MLDLFSKEEGGLSLEKEKAVRLAGFNVWQKDFNKALDAHQGAHSEAIGAPKVIKNFFSIVKLEILMQPCKLL